MNYKLQQKMLLRAVAAEHSLLCVIPSPNVIGEVDCTYFLLKPASGAHEGD